MRWQQFVTLVRLDAKLAVRHRLVHVVLIVATGFGALIGFALPETLELSSRDYFADHTRDQRFAPALAQLPRDRVRADETALRAAVRADSGSVGLVLRGTAEAPAALVIHQGYERPERIALLRSGADAFWRHVGRSAAPPGPRTWHSETVLDPGARKPPFNQRFVPVMFALDACLLGFMFAAVMLLQEKQSGTIGCFRIAPAGAVTYVAAKLVVNLGLILLNVAILVGLALGFAAPALLLRAEVYLLMLLAGAGMTLTGLGLAVFFRNLSTFFYPMAVVGLVGAVPMYKFITPAAELDWAFWLPTYQVLFGADAMLFTGNAEVATTALLFSAVFAGLSALFAGWAVQRRLLKEVA